MTNEKNIPALRFPEFTGEWFEQQLGELFEFKNGINASKEDYGHGRKFINVLDIIQNDYITHEAIIGSVNVSPEDFNKYIVEHGDIVFQRSSETREEVGQANVYLDDEPATFGGFVIRGKKIANYDPYFINQLLKTEAARKEIVAKSGGSTRYNVGQEILKAVTIKTTSPLEQQKIATFLAAVDERLRLLETQREELQRYKQGVMQRIFDRELRFRDEDGEVFPEWEEKRLGEIGSYTGGGTPSSTIEEYWTGNIPWISSSDLTDESTTNIAVTRFITKEAIAESATKLVAKGSVLIVSRVGIGKFAVAPTDLCTSQDFTSLTTDQNPYFLAELFSFRKSRFIRMGQGTSIKGFTVGDVKGAKFNLPRKNEQDAIMQYLSLFDKQLTDQAERIDETKRWKTGLLQSLFI